MMDQVNSGVIFEGSLLTDYDVHLFREGNHFHLHEKLGAHVVSVNNVPGTVFAVWAPNAQSVAVIGDFNGWNPQTHLLGPRWDSSGIWEGFIPGVARGTRYKYHIVSPVQNYAADKGDPFAFSWELSPQTASVVWDTAYSWEDAGWMKNRSQANRLSGPISILEVHLGSWRRIAAEGNRFLTYREAAPQLADYVHHTGFTHVELMPVMEHPFYGSWGYQTVGYFAPTSRFGTPQDFMYFVDYLHQRGIGVILDWVPSHFPSDGHGIVYFDGTCLYEHEDPRQGYHPDWNSLIFNYGRNEVRSFLISSALFWLKQYHADGLRVAAVASILYLDYSRKDGEWVPNECGGNENLPAISFLKRFNEEVYRHFPDTQTMAEESTAWPMVSRPVYLGGLGFGMKWNMGWMHDTLSYFSNDPLYRKHHHDQLTFSIMYSFYENFVLSLSHDEVVHGKGSLLARMPGDHWQKFANLRLLFGYMYTHPGKKLLFMGSEFGQWNEWWHEKGLDWQLLDHPWHQGMLRWVRELNHAYRREPALHAHDFDWRGFQWIDCNNWEESIISFLRRGTHAKDMLLAICNFTPVPRYHYRVGVPDPGYWQELLNSDAKDYGGSGHGNLGGLEATPVPCHGMYNSLSMTLPPLGIVVLRHAPDAC